MKYLEVEVKRMLKAGELSLEEQIEFNILNFIRTIHLNELDFIESSFRSEFFGELPMTFKKKTGQVMGLITATINGKVRRDVFNDRGYEAVEDMLDFTID